MAGRSPRVLARIVCLFLDPKTSVVAPERVANYIEENLSEDLSIATLAGIAG